VPPGRRKSNRHEASINSAADQARRGAARRSCLADLPSRVRESASLPLTTGIRAAAGRECPAGGPRYRRWMMLRSNSGVSASCGTSSGTPT
jgi:hypothetical protein